MGNTRDSSGVNPEGEARGIYNLDCRECITRKHLRGWFDWFVPLQAYNYCCASRLYRVLFYGQTGMLCQATFGSVSLILLVVSQQTSG